MRSPVALMVTSLAATVMAATFLLPTSHASKCSYTFAYRDAMQGTFSSPGYPANYPEHITCFYRFEAANNGGVQIKFEVFHLEGYSEKERNCVYDYIDVYAEDMHSYKVFLGRYCGNTLPPPITSPQSTLIIEFVSDYTKPSMGFYGTYTFLGDNWQPFEHNSVLCGPGQREGSGGVIQSPNYPQPYPPRIHCSWLIRVRDHEQVLLMIDDLDIGTSSQCTSASSGALQIYYGYATNNTLPNESICGQIHSLIASRKRESASPSSRVVIRFITGPDNRDSSRGFRLTWTAIHLPQEGPCPEFQCAGGFACGLEGLGGLCDQLPRYCIHNDQRCDGIANCGQHDDSDERRCPREVLIMTALIAVPSLGVLSLLVVVLYCVRTKRVKKSCSQNQPLTATVSKQGSSSQSFNSHRSYQQCVMHTSFVDGGGAAGGEGGRGGGGGGGGPGDSATLRSMSGGSQGRPCSGGGGGGAGGGGGDEAMLMMMTTMDHGPFPPPPPPAMVGLGPSGVSPGRGLPYMEEVSPEIDEQQLQIPIPIPRPPDPNYRTHQKRASYTMMKQNYEDGNAATSDI